MSLAHQPLTQHHHPYAAPQEEDYLALKPSLAASWCPTEVQNQMVMIMAQAIHLQQFGPEQGEELREKGYNYGIW